MSSLKTTPAKEMPVIELSDWFVAEVTPGNERLFIGSSLTAGGCGVVFEFVSFDKETKTGITKTGRHYKLVGEPGINGHAMYAFTMWCRINNIESYEDVSDEYTETCKG